ncbi:hypothetical protein NTGM5_10039 [Candidatus Nitrotoga sp. M5]|nr:hypothetical protein NTGM5_10039 [Candidatus Nitrotoga sp. M5]
MNGLMLVRAGPFNKRHIYIFASSGLCVGNLYFFSMIFSLINRSLQKAVEVRITNFIILMERGIYGFYGMFTTASGIEGKNTD